MKAWLWIAALGAVGCAQAPARIEAPATAPLGPKLHLVLTPLGPTNVGQQVIDADVESWPRPNAGPVLYASPSGPDADCAPNVTLSFSAAPLIDTPYRVGSDVQLFIEAQCGLDGEMRSWRASTGVVTIAATADGFRVHIAEAHMAPSVGDNGGFGSFVVSGMGSGLVLHAS